MRIFLPSNRKFHPLVTIRLKFISGKIRRIISNYLRWILLACWDIWYIPNNQPYFKLYLNLFRQFKPLHQQKEHHWCNKCQCFYMNSDFVFWIKCFSGVTSAKARELERTRWSIILSREYGNAPRLNWVVYLICEVMTWLTYRRFSTLS